MVWPSRSDNLHCIRLRHLFMSSKSVINSMLVENGKYESHFMQSVIHIPNHLWCATTHSQVRLKHAHDVFSPTNRERNQIMHQGFCKALSHKMSQRVLLHLFVGTKLYLCVCKESVLAFVRQYVIECIALEREETLFLSMYFGRKLMIVILEALDMII